MDSSRPFLKYSGMAFELLAYLTVGVFLGKKLDRKFHTTKHWFTIGLTLSLLLLYFFRMFTELNKSRK